MHVLEHPLVGPVIRLTHGADEALVALLGAHVVAWRRAGRDMLWCATSRLDGKPLRGGIPVCWPWFAAHPEDAALPFHGVARLRPWNVVARTPSTVAMSLAHGSLQARLEVTLGDELSVSLTTRNAGSSAVSMSAALHTYLAVDDIGGVHVSGLDRTTYIDKLDGDARKMQQGDLAIDREVDRIYGAGQARLVEGARSVEVYGAGTSRSLVVWNPWIDKAARLADLPGSGFTKFICIETANAWRDQREIVPGASHILKTKISQSGPRAS
jgi:glucose-6-phosphate 1-epimerase